MADKTFSIPQPPEKGTQQLAVLEAFHHPGTAEIARAIADVFNIKGDVETTQDIHMVADGPRRLAVYQETGTIWYLDTGKLGRDDYQPDLPSPKQAEKEALDFLRRNDWLPENYVVDHVAVSETEFIKGREERQRSSRQNHICVNFRPYHGKIESYGPGGKIKVYLGHEGELIGLFRAVTGTGLYAHYPIIPHEQVQKILERRLGQRLDKLKPTNAKLVYHAQSSVTAFRFVQPAYLFEFEAEAQSKKAGQNITVPFEMRLFPATRFAPLATIESDERELTIKRGEQVELRCGIEGGTAPFDIKWHSDFDGELATGAVLDIANLSVAHRQDRILPHVITVSVTDRNGMNDTDVIRINVKPARKNEPLPNRDNGDGPDPYVGVEWCNTYGSPGLANITGTDDSAQGFKDGISALSGWSSRFDWGNAAAWEQDFKMAGAADGGTDTLWADNVHFAFFAGHGSSGRFWFGSTVDDHEMRAEDASWGDGHLNWIVLHACQTMRANFEWDIWCDAFNGLHQMFGFHTNTQGSTPPLGTRFAFWSSFRIWPWGDSLFTLRDAWHLACTECYDSSREYSMIYAGQSGTDTANDHLPGFGFVSADPTSPTWWAYNRETC